jgi:hypothetical protein
VWGYTGGSVKVTSAAAAVKGCGVLVLESRDRVSVDHVLSFPPTSPATAFNTADINMFFQRSEIAWYISFPTRSPRAIAATHATKGTRGRLLKLDRIRGSTNEM